jgi:hypothetical protein
MKLIFISATLTIIYYMRYERVVKCTYDRDRDTFRSWIMVIASWLLAFLFHERIKGRGFLHYQVEVRRPKKRRISHHHLHILVHVWTSAGTGAMLCVRCLGSQF